MLPSTMDIPVVVLQVSPKMSEQLRFSKKKCAQTYVVVVVTALQNIPRYCWWKKSG